MPRKVRTRSEDEELDGGFGLGPGFGSSYQPASLTGIRSRAVAGQAQMAQDQEARTQASAQARLQHLRTQQAQFPGRAIGGSGLTGLTKYDARGWSRMLEEQQELENLERSLRGQGPLNVEVAPFQERHVPANDPYAYGTPGERVPSRRRGGARSPQDEADARALQNILLNQMLAKQPSQPASMLPGAVGAGAFETERAEARLARDLAAEQRDPLTGARQAAAGQGFSQRRDVDPRTRKLAGLTEVAQGGARVREELPILAIQAKEKARLETGAEEERQRRVGFPMEILKGQQQVKVEQAKGEARLREQEAKSRLSGLNQALSRIVTGLPGGTLPPEAQQALDYLTQLTADGGAGAGPAFTIGEEVTLPDGSNDVVIEILPNGQGRTRSGRVVQP